MEAKGRRGRQGEQVDGETESIVVNEETQTEAMVDPIEMTPFSAKRREGTRSKKTKSTLSFSPEFAEDLDVVASSLGVDKGDLVERLCRPLLKGYRKPTIPDNLKRLFGRQRGDAA